MSIFSSCRRHFFVHPENLPEAFFHIALLTVAGVTFIFLLTSLPQTSLSKIGNNYSNPVFSSIEIKVPVKTLQAVPSFPFFEGWSGMIENWRVSWVKSEGSMMINDFQSHLEKKTENGKQIHLADYQFLVFFFWY